MPKLLLDANISWRVINYLKSDVNEISHVDKIDVAVPAKDIDIWNWAFEKGFIIITNDEDFLHLLLQKGFPPKVVLLKKGNLSTRETAETIKSNIQRISWLANQEEYGLLEIL